MRKVSREDTVETVREGSRVVTVDLFFVVKEGTLFGVRTLCRVLYVGALVSSFFEDDGVAVRREGVQVAREDILDVFVAFISRSGYRGI